MSKQKKKRNKKYQGADAAVPTSESVTRITAVQRGPVREWLHVHKRRNKAVAITAAVLAFITLIVSELIRLIF